MWKPKQTVCVVCPGCSRPIWTSRLRGIEDGTIVPVALARILSGRPGAKRGEKSASWTMDFATIAGAPASIVAIVRVVFRQALRNVLDSNVVTADEVRELLGDPSVESVIEERATAIAAERDVSAARARAAAYYAPVGSPTHRVSLAVEPSRAVDWDALLPPGDRR